LKAEQAFHRRLGDIQDAEVLLSRAMAFARQRTTESGASLGRTLEKLTCRRTMLTERFLKSADSLFTFWQPVSSRRRF
jgi:CHAD domain-containing protein